ncbi:MAG: NUDIX hydrolase [Anaerolineales bacterium]
MTALRYCPNCGGKLVPAERSGHLRAVCSACGQVHYVNPIVAAGTLVESEGRVLLIRRAVSPRLGYWALPAGYAEVGEHPEETAIRETLEETGVAVQLDGLLSVSTFGGSEEPFGVLLLYAAHASTTDASPGDDAAEARFFAPSELPSDIAFANHRQAIEAWAQSQASLGSEPCLHH